MARWHNLAKKDNGDGTVSVWLGVEYNPNDIMVNKYTWSSQYGWRVPKGVNYRQYKVESYRAKSLKEWWVIDDKHWIDATIKRGGN